MHKIVGRVNDCESPIEHCEYCSNDRSEIRMSTVQVTLLAALKKIKRTGPHKLTNRAAKWEESDGLVYY